MYTLPTPHQNPCPWCICGYRESIHNNNLRENIRTQEARKLKNYLRADLSSISIKEFRERMQALWVRINTSWNNPHVSWNLEDICKWTRKKILEFISMHLHEFQQAELEEIGEIGC